jgi:hypothetical protein
MDKFDQTIKSARDTHEPSEHFVAGTMGEIMHQKPEPEKKSRGVRFWVPVGAGAAIVILLVFVLLPSGKSSAPGSTSKPANVATTNGQTESGSIPAGTDNASLASDLTNVQGAINQEGVDQNNANTALNDQSQEIAVPTN